MKRSFSATGFAASVAILLIIIDSRTALTSAQTGLDLCLKVIIPSLFPFIVLSGLITSEFIGRENHFLYHIGRRFQIPEGCESLLLIGWIGGYPVGAQCIYQAYERQQLSKTDAERMLAFCNNAGPAFIFGITPTLFTSKVIPWLLWGIQILASMVIGLLIPGKAIITKKESNTKTTDLPSAVIQSVKTMAVICGWVVLARVLIGYLERYLLTVLTNEFSVLIQGLLELSNGSVALAEIKSESLRFVLFNGFLSFGGLCIWLQTISVTMNLSKKKFFIGKLCQTLISFTTSSILCPVLFPNDTNITYGIHFVSAGLFGLLLWVIIAKKVVALRKKVLYNMKHTRMKGDTYAFPKETSPLL